MLKRIRKANRRRGAALMTVVILASAVSLICFSLLQTAVTESDRTLKNSLESQARTVAQASLNEFYGHMIADPNYLSGNYASNPAVGDNPTTGEGNYAYIDASGTATSCRDSSGKIRTSPEISPAPNRATTMCYHLEVALAASNGDNAGVDPATARRIAVVESTVFYHCRGGATGTEAELRSRCDTTRMQERIRERSFADAAWFTDRETTDPELPGAYFDGAAADPYTVAWAQANCAYPRISADSTPDEAANWAASLGGSWTATNIKRSPDCVDPIYNGRDVLGGLVFTNDSHVWTCSTGTDPGKQPYFSGVLASTGSRTWVSANNAPLGLTGCMNGTNSGDAGAPAPAGLRELRNQTPMEMPSVANASTYYFGLAAPQNRFDGATTITLKGDRMDTPASGNAQVPSSGVIYVSGDLVIHGALSVPLTIYVTGSVRIDNDICYVNRSDPQNQQAPESYCKGNGVSGSDTRAILGLISGKSIVVNQSADRSARTIHGVHVSQSNTVYVDNWQNADIGYTMPGFSLPQLNLRGSVETRYRTVWGGINGVDGQLLSGYSKNFVYDNRLASIQPPYFIKPTTASWDRLDLTEVGGDTPGIRAVADAKRCVVTSGVNTCQL